MSEAYLKQNNKPSRFSWGISFVAVQQRSARHTPNPNITFHLACSDIKVSRDKLCDRYLTALWPLQNRRENEKKKGHF